MSAPVPAVRLVLAAVLAVVLTAVSGTAASAHPRGHHKSPLPDRIELPDGFAPEGIVSGRGPRAYVGSLADGDVYQVNLRTGRGRVISQGDGTPSVGMRLDRHGRLWIAGGDNGTQTDGDGDAKVVDTRTGKVLAHLDFGGGFVNDVILTRKAAWFTDSQRAVLYRVPLGRHGKHRAHRVGTRFSVLPLTGAWEQVPQAFNANGIATTPHGQALLVVNSTTGTLYRVNPRTGRATVVDLGGASLGNGDGMLREGRVLYVVRNQLGKVAVLKLNRAGTRGRLVTELTSDDFDVPTTVASYRGSLFLPNARFGTPPTPTTEYWITRVAK